MVILISEDVKENTIMTKDLIDGFIIFLSLIIPLIGVFIFGLIDRFVDIKRKRIYIALVVLVASLVLQNFWE